MIYRSPNSGGAPINTAAEGWSKDFNQHVEGGESETFGKSVVCPLQVPDRDFGTTAQDTDPETTSLGFSARAVNGSDRAPAMNALTLCWRCRALSDSAILLVLNRWQNSEQIWGF